MSIPLSSDPPMPSTEDSVDDGEGSSLRMGAIIGGVVGGILVLAFILVMFVVPFQRRRKQRGALKRKQMGNYDPPYDSLKARGGVLMQKRGYPGSHHPTNSDLVGMMPLLSVPQSDSNGGDSQKTLHLLSNRPQLGSAPPSPPSPFTHLTCSSEDFNPYSWYQVEQGIRESIYYPMPPRPPQDAYARPSFTQHVSQSANFSPRMASRALPTEPKTTVRPLPLPVSSSPRPNASDLEVNGSGARDVPPQYRKAQPINPPIEPIRLPIPASGSGNDDRQLDRNATYLATSTVPSPPPTVSAFPALFERFQSVSSISDEDSLYSQMSMPRLNTVARPSNDPTKPASPSLSAIAERLAVESGVIVASSVTQSKSIKGKEKAMPEDGGGSRPALRKLPTPPPSPPAVRPLPSTREASANSDSTDNTSATKGFISFAERPIPNIGVKRMDTVAISNALQSRARRHTDGAYMALQVSVSDDGSSTPPTPSSVISAFGRDANGETSGSSKGIGAGEDEGYGNIVRNPAGRGKSIKKIVIADRRESPRGGPLGPRTSIRARSTSTSSLLPSNRNNIKVKPRVQPGASAATSLEPLPTAHGHASASVEPQPNTVNNGVDRNAEEGGRGVVGTEKSELPPIPKSPSLYPLTGAFGLSRSLSTRSPDSPGFQFDFEGVQAFLPGTAPLKIGGPKKRPVDRWRSGLWDT